MTAVVVVELIVSGLIVVLAGMVFFEARRVRREGERIREELRRSNMNEFNRRLEERRRAVRR